MIAELLCQTQYQANTDIEIQHGGCTQTTVMWSGDVTKHERYNDRLSSNTTNLSSFRSHFTAITNRQFETNFDLRNIFTADCIDEDNMQQILLQTIKMEFVGPRSYWPKCYVKYFRQHLVTQHLSFIQIHIAHTRISKLKSALDRHRFRFTPSHSQVG